MEKFKQAKQAEGIALLELHTSQSQLLPLYEFRQLDIDSFLTCMKSTKSGSGLNSSHALAAEMSQTFHKIYDTLQEFQSTHNKHKRAASSQKQGLENELYKENKKLRRLHDKIKSWLNDGGIKVDKQVLRQIKIIIETQMFSFKAIKEQQRHADSILLKGQEQKATLVGKDSKQSCINWLTSTIQKLQSQIDVFELDIESIVDAKKKKRFDTSQLESMDKCKRRIKSHERHIGRLESILRRITTNLEESEYGTETLQSFVTKVNKIKDDVEYYLEACGEIGFEYIEFIYEEFDKIEEEMEFGATAKISSTSAKVFPKAKSCTSIEMLGVQHGSGSTEPAAPPQDATRPFSPPLLASDGNKVFKPPARSTEKDPFIHVMAPAAFRQQKSGQHVLLPHSPEVRVVASNSEVTRRKESNINNVPRATTTAPTLYSSSVSSPSSSWTPAGFVSNYPSPNNIRPKPPPPSPWSIPTSNERSTLVCPNCNTAAWPSLLGQEIIHNNVQYTICYMDPRWKSQQEPHQIPTATATIAPRYYPQQQNHSHYTRATRPGIPKQPPPRPKTQQQYSVELLNDSLRERFRRKPLVRTCNRVTQTWASTLCSSIWKQGRLKHGPLDDDGRCSSSGIGCKDLEPIFRKYNIFLESTTEDGSSLSSPRNSCTQITSNLEEFLPPTLPLPITNSKLTTTTIPNVSPTTPPASLLPCPSLRQQTLLIPPQPAPMSTRRCQEISLTPRPKPKVPPPIDETYIPNYLTEADPDIEHILNCLIAISNGIPLVYPS